MKKPPVDLAALITAAALVVSMLIWGVRLEGRVNTQRTELANYKASQEKLNNTRLNAINHRLDLIRKDISDLEKAQR